jgi:hypothetical protein
MMDVQIPPSLQRSYLVGDQWPHDSETGTNRLAERSQLTRREE